MPCTNIVNSPNPCNPICGSQTFLGVQYNGVLYPPNLQGGIDLVNIPCCIGQSVVLDFVFSSTRDDVSIDGTWIQGLFPAHPCIVLYGGPLNPCIDLPATGNGSWQVVSWQPQVVPFVTNGTYKVTVIYTPTSCGSTESNSLFTYPVEESGDPEGCLPGEICCQVVVPITITTNQALAGCFPPCFDPLTIIQDCDNLVTINSTPLDECAVPCVSVNDVININSVVQFPHYSFALTPDGITANCFTVNYGGDWTLLYLPGSNLFEDNAGCFNGYTVLTSTYDSITNITTVCFTNDSPIVLSGCTAPVTNGTFLNVYPCKTLASVNDAPWVGLFFEVTGPGAGTLSYINANLTTFFVSGTTFDVYDSSMSTIVATCTITTSSYTGNETVIGYTINTGALNINENYFATNFVLGLNAQIDCLPCLPQKCRRFTTITLTDTSSGTIIVETTIEDINNNYAIFLNWLYTIVTLGNYTLTVTSSDCFSTNVCSYSFTVCYNYKFTKTGCHTYRLEDNQTIPTKINTVVISDMDGTYTTTLTFDTQYVNFVDIVTPGDGIYTVVVTNNLVPSDSVTFPIYDFCNLLKCYRKLFLYVYCNEVDPCCNNCNSVQLEEYRKKRYELEKLLALGGTLFAYIYKNTIDAYGVAILSGAEEISMPELNELYKKVKEIVNRCGECDKIINVSPCINCNK